VALHAPEGARRGRAATKEQLSELETELKKLSSSVRRSAERDEVNSAVIDALRMQIEVLKRLAETLNHRTL
jgi:septal ring factor EnvC (AmiA/AmiB activator)